MRRFFLKRDEIAVGIVLCISLIFSVVVNLFSSIDDTAVRLIDFVANIGYIAFIIILYLYRKYSFHKFWEFPVIGIVRMLFSTIELLKDYEVISISEQMDFFVRRSEPFYLFLFLIATVWLEDKVERTQH